MDNGMMPEVERAIKWMRSTLDQMEIQNQVGEFGEEDVTAVCKLAVILSEVSEGVIDVDNLLRALDYTTKAERREFVERLTGRTIYDRDQATRPRIGP